MSQFETVARPYAKAAYQQALADNSVNDWQLFLQLSSQIASSKALAGHFSDPEFLPELRTWLQEGLKKVRKAALSDAENNFLQLLQQNRRLEILPEIALQYDAQVVAAKGVCQAKVHTAHPLSEKQKLTISALLKKKIGREVVLEEIEAPELLAGVRIEYDGLVLDQSAKGRIEQFTRKLDDLRN